MKILLKITVVFLLLSLNSVFFSQSKFTISGTVSDQASGEGMIGVRIKVSELSGVGTNTNEYGFYSLTLNQGTYALEISSFGYEIKYQTISRHCLLKGCVSADLFTILFMNQTHRDPPIKWRKQVLNLAFDFDEIIEFARKFFVTFKPRR